MIPNAADPIMDSRRIAMTVGSTLFACENRCVNRYPTASLRSDSC